MSIFTELALLLALGTLPTSTALRTSLETYWVPKSACSGISKLVLQEAGQNT